jgi:fumarate hydratase class I
MPEFTTYDSLPLGPDSTRYRLLTSDLVSTATFEGQEVLKVEPQALTLLAREGFRDVSFLYRASHLLPHRGNCCENGKFLRWRRVLGVTS